MDGYAVTVQNETRFIEKAFVTLSTTQSEPDENGNVTESESISVELPENIKVDDYNNRGGSANRTAGGNARHKYTGRKPCADRGTGNN